MIEHKMCNGCSEEKPLTDFHVNRANRDGRQTRCRSCVREAWRQKYESEDKDERRERRRWNNLKRLYGVSKEDYDRMYESQDGRCAICDIGEQVLCVDHCHVTLEIRGLLCSECNFALGKFNDSPFRLRRALRYLEVGSEDVNVAS